MGMFIFLLICLFFWWVSRQSPGKHASGRENRRQTHQQPLITDPAAAHSTSSPVYGASNSQESNVLRRPLGDCICGCNGVPLIHLPEYSINYEKYKECPARKRRKETGIYTDDLGNRSNWRPAGQRRKTAIKSRKIAQKREREVAKIHNKLEVDRKQALQRQAREQQESLRHSNGAPALSPAEALRRGLDTYFGKQCGVGHDGERHIRNGECVECRRIDQTRRGAMRRGAYPKELTPGEKKRIGQIYAEARRLTMETGISHHVDHIKPLAAGGEHHPDNLRVITAEENLKKGATWDSTKSQSKPQHRSQAGQLETPWSSNTYRDVGAGRREELR